MALAALPLEPLELSPRQREPGAARAAPPLSSVHQPGLPFLQSPQAPPVNVRPLSPHDPAPGTAPPRTNHQLRQQPANNRTPSAIRRADRPRVRRIGQATRQLHKTNARRGAHRVRRDRPGEPTGTERAGETTDENGGPQRPAARLIAHQRGDARRGRRQKPRIHGDEPTGGTRQSRSTRPSGPTGTGTTLPPRSPPSAGKYSATKSATTRRPAVGAMPRTAT